MKKLSDFKGDAAIDVLADVIEPFMAIISDEDIKTLREETRKHNEDLPDDEKIPLPVYKLVKPALKNHKNEVFEILSIFNEQTIEELKANVTAAKLPAMLISLFSDPDLMSLFMSQGQISENSLASSGSATENIEAEEQ